jgi:hypothetical protein
VNKIRYYDITKVVSGRQKFVAKTNNKVLAERIAKMVLKDEGVRETRVVAWYKTDNNTPKFKLLKTITK